MFGSLGGTEMLLFGIIALLLFGSRLPEVARNLGGSYRELRKHLNDFQREFQAAETYEPPKRTVDATDVEPAVPAATGPRFIPPPSVADSVEASSDSQMSSRG